MTCLRTTPQTSSVPLQIQFETTPKAPTVQFLPSALLSFQEDEDIALTDIVTITPAGGRGLKDVTLKLDIPSSDLGLSVYLDGVDVTGQEVKLSSVADATGEVDLSRLTLRGEPNAKGTVEGVTLSAYDTVPETLATSQSGRCNEWRVACCACRGRRAIFRPERLASAGPGCWLGCSGRVIGWQRWWVP